MKRKIFSTCFLIFWRILLHQHAYGQGNAETVYQRLLKTQEDYREALLTGDSAQIAEVCYLLGKRYIGVGNYPRAQQWLLKSLSIRQPRGPSESIGKIYLRLSESQIVLQNYPSAKSYTHLALFHFKKVNSLKGLSAAYRNLGDLERISWNPDNGTDKSLDSAAHCYRKSLRISASLHDSLDLAVTYQSLGLLFDLKNDENRSLDYFNKAILIYEQNNQVNNIADLATRIAQSLLTKNNLTEAKRWLDRAVLADAQNKGHLGVQESLLRTLATYYERNGEWEKAMAYNKQVLAIKTEKVDTGRQEAMVNINLAYENELNLAEMEAQKRQNDLQKKLTGALFILFALTAIGCFLFYLLFVKYRKTSRENAILVKEQNHRTKNNLQSVSDLLSLQIYSLSDPQAIEAMEESLLRVQAMALLHRSLYQGKELIYIQLRQYIPDLVDMVLRTYRRENVKVYYEIDPALLHTDYAISLGLIVNELTTNACKYAFAGHYSPELHVGCKIRNGDIIFEFQDNGEGIPAEVDQNKGFGLDLIQILADRLKGKGGFTNDDGCAFFLSFKAETKPEPADYQEKLKAS
nr:histidine kinase dimerization/phosphoacceptor domain -containing protein [uncultured Dyadobacter sp.]